MKSDVYIQDCKNKNYAFKNFNPSKKYIEGINIDIKCDETIYDNFRQLLKNMKLDLQNYGTKNWNPFKDFINKGDTVIIKPNLVKDFNPNDTTDCLITNFTVIKPILDYVILSLGKTGRIIIGDSPVQECDFEKVIKLNNLKDSIEKYNQLGFNVELMDFRKNSNNELKCRVVSLDNDSSFSEIDDYCQKYAITNYNLKDMHEHHKKGKHEYLIPEIVLKADVIINIPKPKSHRKAGMTACMKNFIGVNAKKEYLPHHRNGSIHEFGDEFPEKSIIKKLKSNLKNYTYTKNKLLLLLNRFFGRVERLLKKDRYLEGSWYGNDTIWRTILDINKIIQYANKNGEMCEKEQRIIFNVADMIVCGEKEGPLCPKEKRVGYLVAGFTASSVDLIICKIMGFDFKKIKYIFNIKKTDKYNLAPKNCYSVYGNNGNIIKKLNLYNQHFIPTDGWKEHIEDTK